MSVLAKEIEATYEVLSKMGEGGMGSVYKVRHRFFDEVRVIKVMQAEFETVDELKERFLGEAKRGKQLRHPNLAEVIDFSVAADGTSYMVMEYIEGMNLRQLMTRTGGPLDYRVLIPIADQVLAALGYLHEKKFVHRDISPDNIMLTNEVDTSETRVKLIDLGIAKSMDATKSLTMAGRFIGKVQYASPEQFSGRVDGRSDLYSFGVVLYELLTGAKPIIGKDHFAILGGHVSRPPRSFGETDPENRVPAVIRDAVLKALEKNPESRFQSAGEFARALRAAFSPSELKTLERPLISTVPGDAPQSVLAVPDVTAPMSAESQMLLTVTQPVTTQQAEEVVREEVAAPAPAVAAVAPVRSIASALPRWYPVAVVIVLILLVGIAVLWNRSAKIAKPDPVPAASESTATAAATMTVEVPTQTDVPVAAPGQLVINALPWGLVTSVTDQSGTERLTAGSTETPVVLLLAPGTYKVRLTNPHSNRSIDLDATVTSNALALAETELDRIDAVAYVDGIGIGRP